MLLGRRIAQRRHTLGFTLVEVLVSIIVIAIGLLGAAKMQALAVSSAAGAGKRSLAALEADSLAASMHVNHGFWQSGALTAPITVTSAGVANPVLGVPTDCTAGGSAPCTATQVAAFELGGRPERALTVTSWCGPVHGSSRRDASDVHDHHQLERENGRHQQPGCRP